MGAERAGKDWHDAAAGWPDEEGETEILCAVSSQYAVCHVVEIDFKWRTKTTGRDGTREAADGHVTFAEVLPSALPSQEGRLLCCAVLPTSVKSAGQPSQQHQHHGHQIYRCYQR